MNAIDSFRAAMRTAGLDHTGPLIADGKLHRFRSGDDRQSNSWYVLHSSPPMAGKFGCWKRGIKETWSEKRRDHFSDAEWRQIRERWHQADLERERAETERHTKARKQAASILDKSVPASSDHAYLRAKGVGVFGDLRQQGGSLVLPLRDANGALHSLQFITADGTKRFLPGGRVAGTFFTLADQIDGPLVICEGYATGASIYEATGFATACAMNCGNLKAVADALRAKWPARDIIIAADNDAWTTDRSGNLWNPGIEAATAATRVIGAMLAIPNFKDTTNNPTDFNDLHQREGTANVKHQIENSATPPETEEVAITHLAADKPQRLDTAPHYTPPPLDLLPAELQEFTLAACESLNVDTSFILLPLLSSIGHAVGHAREVQLKHGFTQPPIIWTAFIGDSGTKKSPSLDLATFAVTERERELIRNDRAACERHANELAQWEAANRERRGPRPIQPPVATGLMDDLTLAILASVLADNPRGVLVKKDELSHWFESFDQFTQARGADVSRWLSLHTGAMFACDRKTNREHLRLFNPRVCIAGGIQPKTLRRCLTEDFFDRGLPARFLFAWPPHHPDRWTEATVQDSIRKAAMQVFNRLFTLKPSSHEHDDGQPRVVTLDRDAKAAYVEFYNSVAESASEADERSEAAWHKITGYGARLALLGQLTRGDEQQITLPVMQAATELARWFGAEANRAYRLLAEPVGAASTRKLTDFIRRRGGVVTVRDTTTNFWPLKNKNAETEIQFNQLVARGLGEWMPMTTTPKGGQPTRRFRLTATEDPHLHPQNLGFTEESGGCADADATHAAEIGVPQVSDPDEELAPV